MQAHSLLSSIPLTETHAHDENQYSLVQLQPIRGGADLKRTYVMLSFRI